MKSKVVLLSSLLKSLGLLHEVTGGSSRTAGHFMKDISLSTSVPKIKCFEASARRGRSELRFYHGEKLRVHQQIGGGKGHRLASRDRVLPPQR